MPKKEPKILDSIFRRNYQNRLLKLALYNTIYSMISLLDTQETIF